MKLISGLFLCLFSINAGANCSLATMMQEGTKERWTFHRHASGVLDVLAHGQSGDEAWTTELGLKPGDYSLDVTEEELSLGAEYLVPAAGGMKRMAIGLAAGEFAPVPDFDLNACRAKCDQPECMRDCLDMVAVWAGWQEAYVWANVALATDGHTVRPFRAWIAKSCWKKEM